MLRLRRPRAIKEMPVTEKSETISKKKRGRPRLLDPDHLAQYRDLMGNELSERTLQNRHFVSRASSALGLGETPADHPYRYLISPDGVDSIGKKTVRFTILTELGRMADLEDMRYVADHICASRLPTAAAVALIRRVRLGDAPPPAPDVPPDRLVDAILAAINTHLHRYPHDRIVVGAALREALETVEYD